MAYDYNKTKQLYEGLNEEQKKQYAEMNKNDTSGNYQRFIQEYNAEKAKASTPTSTTNVAKPEYQGSGNQTQVTTPYQNQGEGQYSYNEKSGYYEKQGTSGASTPTTPTTPTSTSTSGFSAAETAKIRNAWDALTYEQQQQKLKENPNLRANLSKYGAVEKTAPVSETPKEETPKTEGTKGEWDYQDNSPERMTEMADNVNRFAVSDPQLFTNEEAFRNFFIDGKGRTPEQEKFLMDFYKNRKMYNKLDTYTSDQVGSMYVNGEIPESYLTYLKNTDPERYAAVMDAKAAATDRIKDSASLDTINSLQGGEDTSTSKVIQWLKDNGLLVDKDGNLVDDRRENYASDEENKYLKEIADLNARNLDIDNTVKHTFDDLVEKYPGATKATLMAMAQDINSDLLREKENNLVELTKFQGYVNYMQSERQEMNAAGADTINQLQKQYGMYYQYSPEGLSELAQMEYAATNVTLDQADNGTDAQKQMALDQVLTGIYDKYGSIIQRSKSQVINDVMALAKKKGISLSQALEENFLKQLRSKDQYNQLSQGTEGISWTKIGEDADGNAIYGFVDTYNKTVTPYGTMGGTATYDTSTRQGKANTIKDIVSYNGTDDLGGVVSDIYAQFNGKDYGECGYLVNDYYKAVTGDTNNLITGTFKDRKGLFTKNTPSAGDVVLFDWTNSPTASDKQKEYGHVALVEGVDATGVWIVDANWDGNGSVARRHINFDDPLYQDRVYGFYDIPQQNRQAGGVVNMGYIDSPDAIAAYEEFNKLGSKGLDTAAKQKRAKELFNSLGVTENEFKIMANAYWDDQNAKQAQTNIDMIDNLLADIGNLPDIRTRSRLGTPNSFGTLRGQADGGYGVLGTLSLEAMSDEDLAQYNKWASDYDMLMANLMYDKYQDIKSTGGTFGSMSNAEWDNLKQAATNLKFNQDAQTYYNNLLKLRNQFENLASYGGGKQSTTQNMIGNTGYKTDTLSSLLGRFSSY